MYLQRNQRNIDRLNDATDIGGQGKENGMENIGIDENDESVVILSESTVIWSDRDLFWSESVVIWSDRDLIWFENDQNPVLLDEIYPGKLGINLKIYIFS